MNTRRTLLATLALAVSVPVSGAMYKWVDEQGITHYADSVPPKYASRAVDRAGKPLQPPKREAQAAGSDAAGGQQDAEANAAEAKRRLDQQRQDQALLATYTSEGEIELARSRELKRNQDTMRMASAGLAASKRPEDQRKLDSLMELSRKETDSINAKFDAQKARYREIARPAAAGAGRGHTPVAAGK
jgi:hypothetical protein